MANSTFGSKIVYTLQNPKGLWNSAVNYNIGDSVTYGGSTYVAASGSTNIIPTNSTVWNIGASKGDPGAVVYNILDNGNFRVWQRGLTSVSCTADVRNFRSDRWAVVPSASAVTQVSDTSVPNINSLYSLKVTGDTSVKDVNISQRIESLVSTTRCNTPLVFSAYIYNGTGASFTPSFLVGTPTAVNDFSTSSFAFSSSMNPCSSSVWTRVSCSFNPSGFTNITNGVQFDIKIPDGSMNTTGKHVKISQVQLEQGTTSSLFVVEPNFAESIRCQRYYYVFQDACMGMFYHNVGVLHVNFPYGMPIPPATSYDVLVNYIYVNRFGQYPDETSTAYSVTYIGAQNSTSCTVILFNSVSNNLQVHNCLMSGYAIGINGEL